MIDYDRDDQDKTVEFKPSSTATQFKLFQFIFKGLLLQISKLFSRNNNV